MLIKADLHIHTTLSACCNDAEQQVDIRVPLLAEKGLETVAFTDHIWRNPAIPASPWYAPQNGDAILKLVREIHNRDYPIRVLAGCEADMIAPDKIGITKDFCEKMDVMLLSTDHFHMREFMEDLPPCEADKIAPYMMKFFRAGASCGLADILAHPLYPRGAYVDILPQIMEQISESELDESFRMAAENNVGLEINGSCLTELEKRGLYDCYLHTMKAAKKAGCKFTVGSESHRLTGFDCYELCNRFATDLGLANTDFYEQISR